MPSYISSRNLGQKGKQGVGLLSVSRRWHICCEFVIQFGRVFLFGLKFERKGRALQAVQCSMIKVC